MTHRDPLVEALTTLETPPLDPRFVDRVGKHAEAELRARSAPGIDLRRLRLVIAGGLVPTLLTLAAVMQSANAASTAISVYGHRQHAQSK
jgi:hypothetical protein